MREAVTHAGSRQKRISLNAAAPERISARGRYVTPRPLVRARLVGEDVAGVATAARKKQPQAGGEETIKPRPPSARLRACLFARGIWSLMVFFVALPPSRDAPCTPRSGGRVLHFSAPLPPPSPRTPRNLPPPRLRGWPRAQSARGPPAEAGGLRRGAGGALAVSRARPPAGAFCCVSCPPPRPGGYGGNGGTAVKGRLSTAVDGLPCSDCAIWRGQSRAGKRGRAGDLRPPALPRP